MRLCLASQELLRVSNVEEEILHVNWRRRLYPAVQDSTVLSQGDFLKTQNAN